MKEKNEEMLVIVEIGYMGLMILYSLLLHVFEIFHNNKLLMCSFPHCRDGREWGVGQTKGEKALRNTISVRATRIHLREFTSGCAGEKQDQRPDHKEARDRKQW